MQITSEQLRQISIFRELNPEQLLQLYPHTMVQYYSQGEIILHEGDSRSGRLRQRLPPKLFAVFSGVIQIKKTASTGKETILRTLPAGEIFAAPALFGDGISPATVVADRDSEILTIDRSIGLALSYSANARRCLPDDCTP
jgi:CRP/FNR family transcriptional regulator, cyclic AMP receptor protein